MQSHLWENDVSVRLYLLILPVFRLKAGEGSLTQQPTLIFVFKGLREVRLNPPLRRLSLTLVVYVGGDAGGAGSEDCLKVNIYTPAGAQKGDKRMLIFTLI